MFSFIDPIDTIKVVQQSSSSKEKMSVLKTFDSIYQSGNKTMGRFFKGILLLTNLIGNSTYFMYRMFVKS